MLIYYISLTVNSIKKDIFLTLVILLLVGLGVAATMTLITELHVVSGDPIPNRSSNLYYPLLDARDLESSGTSPPSQLTWQDAMYLLRVAPSGTLVAMTGGRVTVTPSEGTGRSFFSSARYTSAGFFKLFGVSLLSGRGWTVEEDTSHARVVVISEGLARKLYGSVAGAQGQSIILSKKAFEIIGVRSQWNPIPHFYDLGQGAFSSAEDIFIPLLTSRDLQLSTSGSVDCWGEGPTSVMEVAPCAWIQVWVQLDSPFEVENFKRMLIDYSESQYVTGRYLRRPNVRLYGLNQWLDYNKVVPSAPKLQLTLAVGFLFACLVNAVAILLIKFIKLKGDLAVRRALGARRGSIFCQLLTEAGFLGLLSAIVGLILTWAGLFIIRQQPDDYSRLAFLDVPMCFLTAFIAFTSTMLAGIFPAWSACRAPPASSIKIQ